MVYALAKTPLKLASLAFYRNVYIQVQGAVNVSISNQETSLQTPAYGVQQGLTFSSADGVVRLPWVGELWAVGDGGLIDVEII